jgi:DNA polymerase V
VLPENCKQIALIDCNNFYASCERVFQPSWRYRPVAILSNNDGCIIARSEEVKIAGIPMGAPYFKYKNKLADIGAITVSSNYELYSDMSARVMKTLADFSSEMEIYSIDEAWLDLSNIPAAKVIDYAEKITSIVAKNTGIPVSLGLGSTKVLAKIANKICKHSKAASNVFSLGDLPDLSDILKDFAVADIWGIGRRLALQLNQDGIYTALQLRDINNFYIRKKYSVVVERIVYELRGVACLEFEHCKPKKQIRSSRSFGERVTTLEPLLESVANHVSNAAEKLRKQGSVCSLIVVFIRTGAHNPNEPFYANSAQISLPVSSADTNQLIAMAQEGVRKIFKSQFRYNKAGVVLAKISKAKCVQLSFFAEPDNVRAQARMRMIDNLNARFGKNSIFIASCGTNKLKSWRMKRLFLTQSYTTRWGDLPIVR